MLGSLSLVASYRKSWIRRCMCVSVSVCVCVVPFRALLRCLQNIRQYGRCQPIFPENCMKMKKIGRREGRASKILLSRLTTDMYKHTHVHIQMHKRAIFFIHKRITSSSFSNSDSIIFFQWKNENSFREKLVLAKCYTILHSRTHWFQRIQQKTSQDKIFSSPAE